MRRFFLLLFAAVAFSSCTTAKIDVLLLTGHTDKWHCWEVMSDTIVELLGEYEPFEVDVVEYDSEATFSPNFEAYDVVILNQNEVTWSAETQHNFESYVNSGGGVVVVHEADNAHPDWVEYNRMIALGGWGDRDKSSGVYYYWLNGEFIRDATPGRCGHHGKRGSFEINVRDMDHPIMEGLPQSWMHYNDELYCDMRGPAEQIEVLATAFSTLESGGSGKEEPIIFTVRYGEGRIFHTTLGHTREGFLEAVENNGFRVTLSRGIEWAATGKVRQKSIDF